MPALVQRDVDTMNIKAAVANSNEAAELGLFSVNFSSTGV